MPLTNKQQRFVEEYLIDLNATQAAIRAGYAESSAKVSGHNNITNYNVQAAISKAQKARANRTEITADRVLRELAILGFTDMGDYLRLTEKGGAYLDWSDLPEGATKAISEITQEIYMEGSGDEAERVKRTKFKLYDKRAALVDIGKHLGMFVDRKEVGGPGDFANLTDEQIDQRIDEIDRQLAELERGKGRAQGRQTSQTTH